jgi:uncharacterized SAM-binding protein YcdF (DUF218 family)
LPHFVVLYGGKVEGGRLNLDSVDRCKAAITAARRYPGSCIIFGVDFKITDLHRLTVEWLRDAGWPSDRLILNPKGHISLGETEAAIEVLNRYDTKEVIIATSWYHVPRVWMIWRTLFPWCRVSFSVARVTKRPVISVLYEMAAIPKFFLTIFVRRVLRPFRAMPA